MKEQLIKQSVEKFNEAVENFSDLQKYDNSVNNVNECIIVFFNLEILREQI